MDYAGLLRALMPHLKRADIPLPDAVIDAASKKGVIEGFLRFIPRKKQDEMVVGIVNKNRSRIIRRGEKIAEGWGIPLKIGDLHMRILKPSEKLADKPAADKTADKSAEKQTKPDDITGEDS